MVLLAKILNVHPKCSIILLLSYSEFLSEFFGPFFTVFTPISIPILCGGYFINVYLWIFHQQLKKKKLNLKKNIYIDPFLNMMIREVTEIPQGLLSYTMFSFCPCLLTTVLALQIE